MDNYNRLTSSSLKGNWASVLLPINKDGSIDFTLIAEQIDYLVEASVDGIYTNGTAGEFYNITEIEYDKISELVATKCLHKKMPFQLGVSHMSPIITAERLQRSALLGAAAFQLILPDWITLNVQEQGDFMQYMQFLAKDTPLVLYNPPHAKTKLNAADFLRLKTHSDMLIGIKVADGDDSWYEAMMPVAEKLAVFVPGHHLATGVKMQVATGAYSNVACLSPGGAQQWWNMMHDNLTEALSVEGLIKEFMALVIAPYQQAGYSNPALDKFLTAIGGWIPVGTRLRWPYRYISALDVHAARNKAKNILPGFLMS